MKKLGNSSLSILCIVVGMTVFAIQDSLIKFLSGSTSVFQIIFIRSIVAVIILSIFLVIIKKPIIFSTNYPKLTLIRVIIFFFGFVLFYIGLAVLPFAVAIALFFTSPFFLTIFSKIFLNQDVGIRRWLTIVIGFIGVFIILNPTFDTFNIYMLFPIITAVCYAASMIIIKKTSEKDSVYTQTFHMHLSAILFAIILGLAGNAIEFSQYNNVAFEFIFRSWEMNSNNFYLLVCVGILAIIGHTLIIQAYRIGFPPTIAPFEYVNLVWAIIIGNIIWNEQLDIGAYIGMGLIVGGGLYIFYRETIRNELVAIDKPLR